MSPVDYGVHEAARRRVVTVEALLLFVLAIVGIVAINVADDMASQTVKPPITITTPDPQDCASMDVETLTDSQINALLWAGWYGVPEDGAERLYSPSCGEEVGHG